MISNVLLQIVWDIDPRIFTGIEIPRWYSVFWIMGLLSSYYFFQKIYRNTESDNDEIYNLAYYLVIGTLIGARLGHVIFYDLAYYIQNPIEILPIKLNPDFQFVGFNGLASHGGGVGAFLALFIYCKKKSKSILPVLDIIAIVVPLLGGFIRIGNLMNSEIIGVSSNVPWAFIFTRVDQIPRHPAQLYEAIFCFIIFIVLFILRKYSNKKYNDGFFIGILLIALFIQRIIDEFFKINQAGFEDDLLFNMGQMLSIPYILIGFYFLVKSFKPKFKLF